MSESSESLHFWQTTSSQTKQFVVATGVAGRIVASNERWTTFIPLADDEITKMALAAPALSLHWTYFEDFGLGLAFFEGGVELGGQQFGWQDSPAEHAPHSLVEALRDRGILDSFGQLEQLAHEVTAGHCAPRLLRDRAAALLELPAYEWISPNYCRDTPLEEMQSLYPEAQDIGAE